MSKPSPCLFLIAAVVPWMMWISVRLAAAEVNLNEIVSSNESTEADEDGDFSDWIELHNPGAAAVDLSGWGLTDAPGTPFKWTFPAGTTLAAGAYQLIWASGKDRGNPAAELHTNFAISASGETIALTLPDGTPVDSVEVPALPRDTSYGRKPDEGDAFFYFGEPTPGSANTTPGYPTLPPVPMFSSAPGFYTAGFNLELSTEPGWTIYYTLDGSDPSPAREGTGAVAYRESHVYSGPIPVASRAGDPNVFSMIPTTKPGTGTDGEPFVREWLPEWRAPNGEVFKATVVRAVAYEAASGRQGSAVTRTFFVDPDIMSRYAGMPVVSLVSDYVNLFDDDTGIYVPGSAATSEELQNFMQDWTRSASVEFFEDGGALAFADMFEIRIQGSSSRTSMQKGLHVATGDESQEPLIDYPLFAARGTSASGTPSFKRFILRAWGSARKWPVPFADAHHQTVAAHSGIEIQDYRPAVVFINGEYWGLHEVRESNKNSWYHQFRTGIDRDSPGYDMLDEGGGIIDEGDAIHWNDLWAYIDSNNVANASVYQEITARVDVENLARYISHCIISGKRDWPQQNESLWRPRTSDGRWRWSQFDMDHGLNDWAKPSYNMVAQTVDGDSGYGPHDLFRELLDNPDFERLFVNTCIDWFNSYFLTEVELAHFDELKAELDPFISEFNNRWPILTDGYYLGWQPGIDYGRGLIEDRRTYRRNQLISYFSLGSPRTLTLDSELAMGRIRCNSLVVDETTPGVDSGAPYPWGGSYYQNQPVALEALPRENHRFVGWIVKRDNVDLPPLPDGGSGYYSAGAHIDLSLAQSGSYSAEAVFEEVPRQDLHVWNYQNGSVTDPSYTIGGGHLTATPSPGGTIYLNAAAQDFTDTHLRVDNPIGAQLQWALPTPGHHSPKLSFLTRRSGSGAGLQHLSYTLDGATWTPFESYSVADAAPQAMDFDFSEIEGAENNSSFAVRIDFAQGDGGTVGNNRFDDVSLAAVPLPGLPVVTAPLEDVQVVAGGVMTQIDLSEYFTTAEGENPAFQAVTDPPGVADLALNGTILDVSGLSTGETTVTVAAMADGQPVVSQSFHVLVHPAAFPVANGDYRFDEWSSGEPAGSYPTHMIFLQSEVDDPDVNTPLERAYAIPSEDAALPEDAAFPYAALSRTRINGLGENGISFINTGRGRDVGSAVLALDTTGQSGIRLKWTAGTVTVNSRIYGLALQYRLDPNEAWTDFPDSPVPVEYIRSDTAGDERVFGPVSLPPSLENQPYVQLQWRYHFFSGDLGARAEIRLDNILVSTGTSFESWAALMFSEAEAADPSVSGPLADYANDGVPNLIKYALGLAPGQPVTPDRLDLSVQPAGGMLARWHLDRSLADISYRIQASPDLADWSETLYDSSLHGGPNSHGDVHEVDIPDDGSTRRFLRMVVERE